MKSVFLGVVVMACSFTAMAQQQYFIFIQEIARQPFYVRMGEESFSSSAGGHIILSQLKDSVYNLYIGFPRSRAAEHLFTITIGRRDHGYELRYADGRWQLFNLSTMQFILPVTAVQANVKRVRRSDSYSELMANVVDDTAVLYFSPEDTAVAMPPPANDTLASLAADSVKKDTAAVAKKRPSKKKQGKRAAKDNTAATPAAQSEAVKADTLREAANGAVADTTNVASRTDTVSRGLPPSDSAVTVTANVSTSVRDKRDIIRLLSENLVDGRLMIYVDRSGPVNDTIRIIIPRL